MDRVCGEPAGTVILDIQQIVANDSDDGCDMTDTFKKKKIDTCVSIFSISVLEWIGVVLLISPSIALLHAV